jgi:hypothetical protein
MLHEHVQFCRGFAFNFCTRKGKFGVLARILFQLSFHVKQVHHLVAQHYSLLPRTPSLTHHHEAAVTLLEPSIQRASHATFPLFSRFAV